jgi:hypothetical protein
MTRSRRIARLVAAFALLTGLVVAVPGSAARPAPVELPLLVVLRTPDLSIGTADSPPTLVGNEVLFGCDPYEQAEQQRRRCLRFDTIVANLGTGALELRYDGRQMSDRIRAVQRIYRRNGAHVDRPAGFFYWDTAHGHFHYADFAVASLWRATRDGRRLGSRPVRQGRKDGFCLEDLGAYSARAAPQQYEFPEACYPTVQPDGSLTQVNGISAGWLDAYDETLTNQSIEVTGMHDGYYLLQIAVDPHRTLRVDPRSRRSSWQLIRLCGDQADLVGRTRHCSDRSTAGLRSGHLAWRALCLDGPCPLVRTTPWGRRPAGG